MIGKGYILLFYRINSNKRNGQMINKEATC